MILPRWDFLVVLCRLSALAACVVTPIAAIAQENAPLKLGDLNSYAAYPELTIPYRNGWQLALEEINAKGGILDRKVEIVSRDDGGAVISASKAADELASKEKVALLFGTSLSPAALAVADYAHQNKILFLAAGPLSGALTLERGNAYTFRPLRASASMQAQMLADQIQDPSIKRWAVIAPDYDYGRETANAFKRRIKQNRSDNRIVAEQYPTLGAADGEALADALQEADPQAIFCSLFGDDLAAFIRAGSERNLFAGRTVLAPLAGEPEWFAILKDAVPDGWIVTGYPVAAIEDGPHKDFVDAYSRKYNAPPALASLNGYMMLYLIKQLVEEADAFETQKLISELQDFTADTIIGGITVRASDHQGSMGAWVGKVALVDGKPVMTDWSYLDGHLYFAPADQVLLERPQSQ